MLSLLKALRAFEAAARYPSVTAIVDGLSITHSAVSQPIRVLEEYLGGLCSPAKPAGRSFWRMRGDILLIPNSQRFTRRRWALRCSY